MNIIISGVCGFMGRELTKLIADGKQEMKALAGVDPAAESETQGVSAARTDAVSGGTGFPFACSRSFSELEKNHPELVKKADIIIDFSTHTATGELTAFAVENHLPLVVATTGQTAEEKAQIDAAAKEIPVFFAANFSIGIALLVQMAKTAAAALPDAEVEIVEMHHDRKIDAPSGTALTLAKAVQEVRPESRIVSGRNGLGKREPEDIGISSVRIGNLAGIHEVIIGTQNQTITLKHEAHSRALFAEGALSAAAFLTDKKPGLYDMKSLLSQS